MSPINVDGKVFHRRGAAAAKLLSPELVEQPVFFWEDERRWGRPCVYLRWLRSTVGGTPVFYRRTDPVLRSACSRRVTTVWVNRPLQVSQLGQLSLSSFRGQ